MEFAITFKGDIPLKRTISIVKQAEVDGFSSAWLFDSHVLWQECYTTIAVCMKETEFIRFGPCVTNPGVRDWTVAVSMFANLNLISGNRFDAGIGRGDSSRRVLGHKPMTVGTLVEFAQALRVLIHGDKYDYEGQDVQLPWTQSSLPIWMAAYGHKALTAAGQTADGLIIQLADPWLVKWFSDQTKDAGKAARSDMTQFKAMSAAPVSACEMQTAR